MFDVIVVGGGPAGLSAGLMLGRCRRRVLVCDDGKPRNRSSRALHGYLTRDGIAPGDFNALGRAELDKYGVEFRHVTVSGVERQERQFRVSIVDGNEENARFLLIATGVEDELPAVAGLRECYGRSVFHCPYCDGWERRDRRIAVLGTGRSGVRLALSLKTWSQALVLLTNGSRLDQGGRARLARNGVDVITASIARVAHEDGQATHVEFEGRSPAPADAIFFTTGQHPHCDLARTLGCAFNRKGTVDTGSLCESNVPGVFVAGDASRDAQFAVVASAEGIKAALAINRALQSEELQP